jgi:Flp pilus assembly protein TadD
MSDDFTSGNPENSSTGPSPARELAESHYFIALDLVAEGHDEAIEVSKQISALDPDDVLAHTGLSILYQKKGMIPEAEAEANQARILGWKQQLKSRK